MIPHKITLQSSINVPVQLAWATLTEPKHIVKWNFASPQWHCPSATVDLAINGKFNYRMEAKDGSFGFDFSGVYSKIIPYQQLCYTLDDGRTSELTLSSDGTSTKIIQTFEAETENSVELQRNGWQIIMDNHKKYSEDLSITS